MLLLSGDISLNPGPCQTQFIDDKTWEPLKTRGLHFCHLNVNSLFSKIDELRDITNYVKPAILGISESKLDSSVTNAEVNINGYSIIRNDRNRNGAGVACYIRNDLCFNFKNIFSNSIEHIFFEVLIPKVKPIAIGILNRHPNENDFLNRFSNDFQQIDSKTNEIYLLGDFNINLLQNGKFILKENQSYKLKSSSSVLVNKYKEFCQKFSLTEIIKEPTRIKCSTSTRLDHILASSSDKFFLPFRTLNFGISGDKIQNVLWRVYNMTLPASVEYVIIHCGTNNLGHNSPLKIAEGLINIACILKKNYKDLHIFVSCLLPRDDEKSVKRSLLYAVNCYLKELCTDQFHYIDLDSGWTLNNHLNTELFCSFT